MVKLKSNNYNSSVKIGDKNRFQGDTAIGDNARIIKNKIINDNSIKYHGDKIDVSNIESLSLFITSRFDEKKATIWSILSGLGGLVGILLFINSFMTGELKLISYFPKFSYNIGLTGTIISSIFLIGGLIIFSAINYKYESQCPKCEKHYSIREVGTPKVREVDARDGTKRTTTRFYKCDNCDFTDKKSKTETIPYDDDDSDY